MEIWGEAEYAIHHAINEAIRDENRGVTDPSMTLRIANALRSARLLLTKDCNCDPTNVHGDIQHHPYCGLEPEYER